MKIIFRETSDLLEWDMTSFKFTKTKIIEKNLMINRNVKLQKKKKKKKIRHKPKSKTKFTKESIRQTKNGRKLKTINQSNNI